MPGFNNLGHLVTPIFLLMDHFLYQFSTCTLSEKMKTYRLEVLIIFFQNAPSNSVLFSSLVICAAVSNAS